MLYLKKKIISCFLYMKCLCYGYGKSLPTKRSPNIFNLDDQMFSSNTKALPAFCTFFIKSNGCKGNEGMF